MFKSNYGFAARLLHRLALSSSMVAETSFDVERLLYASKTRDVSQDKHVFVSGLARAGTTILMRQLYRTTQFRSLTYRDMPFVLAPNLWGSVANRSRLQKEAEHRAHEDGILVDYDSPEALEEVFWRVFCGQDYIRPSHLIPMCADDETIKNFRAYVALMLLGHNEQRYLSKNNNNILRLGSLVKSFPNAVILVPFRAPIQHAYSLMRQQQQFVEQHEADAFSKKYMTWLVHHEFGADQRPFVFEKAPPPSHPVQELNYWLQSWVNAYAFIVESLPKQAILVNYENLCNDTNSVWERLTRLCDLTPTSNIETMNLSSHSIDSEVSSSLVKEAEDLYREMLACSL